MINIRLIFHAFKLDFFINCNIAFNKTLSDGKPSLKHLSFPDCEDIETLRP